MVSTKIGLFSIAFVLWNFHLAHGASDEKIVQGPEELPNFVDRKRLLEDPIVQFSKSRDAYRSAIRNQDKHNQDLITQALEMHETEAANLELYASEHEHDSSTFAMKADNMFRNHHEALVSLAAEQQTENRKMSVSYLQELLRFQLILNGEIEQSKQTDDFLDEFITDREESLIRRTENLVSNEISEMQEKIKYGNICLNFVGASGQVTEEENKSILIDEMKTALNLALLEQGQELTIIAADIRKQKHVAEKEESRRNLRARARGNALDDFTQELRTSFLVGFRCTDRCPRSDGADLEELAPESVDAGRRFFSNKLEKSVAEALRRQVGGVLGQLIAVESFPCNDL